MKKSSCLFPKCEDTFFARGLCHRHYRMAERQVKKKRTTWKLLIEKGKAKKSTHGIYTREGDWFLK